MAADSYKGIPKQFPLLVNEDGDVKMNKPGPHLLNVNESVFNPITTGSGSLVNGYAYVSDSSVGWHTLVFVSTVSGTGSTVASGTINYTVDPANSKVHFSGIDRTDNRQFAYVLFNPGLKTPKVS